MAKSHRKPEEPQDPLPRQTDKELVDSLKFRKKLKLVLEEVSDDELLKELAERNPMIVYSAARGIDSKGIPLMPTLMVHGGEMQVHALANRLQMFIFTGSTTQGGKHA